MTNAIRDSNFVTVALGVSSTDATATLPLKIDPSTGRLLTDENGSSYTNLTQFVDQTPWRVFYSNGSGDVTELAFGASGTVLQSNGVSSAPTWVAAGAGDVTKVGTPVNNQVGVWTGDGTIEGDAALTFDTTTDTLTTGVLVSPQVYGSAASGGDLLINSTSNATKGQVAIGSATTGFIYDETTNRISIGDTENIFTVAGAAIAAKVGIHAEGASANVALFLERHSATEVLGAKIYGARSKGDETTPTVVASGDNLFDLVALGYDGTDYAEAARINIEVDGTPGAGDMPGRIIFLTSPDGTETPAEAVRISADKTMRLASLTASEIVITDASKNLASAAVATYPSLTELTYVKGVTSAIQTQINAKQATITFGTGVLTALGVNVGSAGAPVLFDGALGTPSSGTLTNATGLPIAGLVASTSTAIGVGSVELGHASDTTITRVSAGVIAVEGVTIPSISSTNTFTNKRITKRTGTTTSSATPTINTDNVDAYSLTAQTEAITSFTTNLSGTPTEAQGLLISVTGTAARAITWGASFENGPVALPTTTVTTTRLDTFFIWNSTTSKWRCMATGSTV